MIFRPRNLIRESLENQLSALNSLMFEYRSDYEKYIEPNSRGISGNEHEIYKRGYTVDPYTFVRRWPIPIFGKHILFGIGRTFWERSRCVDITEKSVIVTRSAWKLSKKHYEEEEER